MTGAPAYPHTRINKALYLALALCFGSVGFFLWRLTSQGLSLPTETLPAENLEQVLRERVPLIPLGVLIVATARTVVGVRTIGTFMPVLLAIAISLAGLNRGLTLVAIILGAGLTFSILLRRFRLLPMPRTAAMVIIVVLLMQGYHLASKKIGMETDDMFNAFPLVILAWMVERMANIIDDTSLKDALIEAGGSICISLVCVGAFKIPHLAFILASCPEWHFFALGLLIALGTYTGFRMSEWWRFAPLTEPATTQPPSQS